MTFLILAFLVVRFVVLLLFDILLLSLIFTFFFNDTATTEIYTLSLHDALPILREKTGRRDQPARAARRALSSQPRVPPANRRSAQCVPRRSRGKCVRLAITAGTRGRSEEHTSELQSLRHLVCRLLLEKKKDRQQNTIIRAEAAIETEEIITDV